MGVGEEIPRTPPLDIRCPVWPDDYKTLRKAKKFGEGFTWTCPNCFDQFVLVQGKGKHWYWTRIER